MKKRTYLYLCCIKSHCESPDYEIEIEATSKKEALNIIMGKLGPLGWGDDDVWKHIITYDYWKTL